jgi:hypothetical protein
MYIYIMSNDDSIQAAVINIEALEKEYQSVLTQYQEAYQNYIDTLNSGASNTFSALPGNTWWGQGGLTEGTASTNEECESMCASNSSCTGATFNPVKKYCWARAGDGILTPGLDSDYALIPQSKANMLVLSGLNDKLLSLNQQMSDTLSQINPQVQQQQNDKTQKQAELNDYYSQLLAEKMKMEQLLEEYNSISEDNDQQTLYANQQNATLRVWAIAACILLLIIVRMFITKSSTQVSVAFWLILIILLIVLSYGLSKPSGFAVWGFLFLAIILMKLRVLPSP